MSSSRILTTLALFQKPKKTRWPDPEKSIGEVCGTKKGKYNCWEAQGPAREVFEQIKPQIKELLSTAGSEVRRGELLLINIFMIGETQATALPHIMFSCRHRESRKTARTAIEKSGILDQCPPGMHLGDWDCPPHLENLRPLASSTSYTSFDDMADFINPPTEDRIGSSFYDYDIFPVLDPHKTRTIQALQLRIRNSPMMPEYLRTATIGAMVQLSDKRFYLAPAHIFPEQCSFTQNIASEDTDQYSEDSDCDFGGFESGDESLSDEQETEFMSQYSATPESSDLEDNWELDGADSSSTTDSDDFSSLEVIERAPDTTGSLDEGDSIPDEVNVHTSHHSVHQDIDSVTNSDNLDYCLIEVGENDYSSSHLPVLSRANIGGLDFEAVHVWAVTGSGCILTGILSSQRSCIRLPKATRFADVLSVKFEHSLQPGDSGSIVRDASTGMIYGHIIAGDIESQTAFIIPVVDVLDDLAVHYKNIEVLSIHNSLQSQSPFLTLRPRVAHYYKLGEMMEPSRELDMAITSPSLARRPSWHTVTPRERHLLTKQAWGAKRACRRTLYPSNCQRDPMLDTLCFEMEDARLQEHFSSLFSSLIIRGLSDYADSLYSREDSEDVRKEHHGIDSLGSGRQYELIKPQSILKRSNLSADIAKYALFGFGNDGKSRIAFEWIMWNLLPETDQRHTDPSEDRSESLQKIAKWVASPKEVFCLHGMGCVGKSILAHTFARNSMLGDSLFIFKRSEQTFPSSEIPLFDHIFTDYLSRIIQQHPLAIFGPSVASQMTALWTLSEPVDVLSPRWRAFFARIVPTLKEVLAQLDRTQRIDLRKFSRRMICIFNAFVQEDSEKGIAIGYCPRGWYIKELCRTTNGTFKCHILANGHRCLLGDCSDNTASREDFYNHIRAEHFLDDLHFKHCPFLRTKGNHRPSTSIPEPYIACRLCRHLVSFWFLGCLYYELIINYSKTRSLGHGWHQYPRGGVNYLPPETEPGPSDQVD